jgi:hypothetical protein
MEEAFQRTKEVFCEHVVLKHPRQDHPYYLSTDASDYALGAVIAQKDDEGTLEPLAFASRALHGAELSYFTTEKELLGIVWSLQKFRSYLLGSKIFVLTDHKALTFLNCSKFVNQRLMRWTLSIQDYDISIEHCAGRKHIVADLLSRNVPSKEKESNIVPYIFTTLATKLTKELTLKLQHLDQEQRSDKEIIEILGKIVNNDEKTMKRYKIIDNVLYRQAKDSNWKAVIPTHLEDIMINQTHELYGHIGAEKCMRLLSEDYSLKKLGNARDS